MLAERGEMAKLTEEERKLALKALAERLQQAIEQTPKGITDAEVRECILKALIELKLLTKEG